MKRDDIIWRKVENEVLLLNTCTGDYFCLNESAGRIWMLLNENKTVDEIANIICKEYDCTFEETKADILDIVKALKENKILEDEPCK